jgi:uncharacterized membrane protein
METMMSDSKSPIKRPLPGGRDRNNPFAAPTAHVEDVRRTLDDTLVADPNRLAAGRGLAWWSESWRLFREATGLWIGIGVVWLLINMALSLIPVVGSVASSLIFPAFGAGLMLGCRSLDSGEGLNFGHLFAGFQNQLGRLLTIGALYLVGMIVIVAIAFLLGFGGGFAAAAAGAQEEAAMSGALLGGLVGALLGIPLMMAVWFAPALVALHDLAAFEAMKLSFRGCLCNILPFLVYGLASIVLIVLACLPLFLGLLALMPVIFCSVYISYRDVFTPGR